MQLIFHIDVNSAFLSWGALDKLKKGDSLDLREVPSIIGGSIQNRHGVVLAKSIPAKKYGIITGEPIVNAQKKCPHLIVEPPNHSSYEIYSKKLFTFLSTISPDLEQVSIDECYMDFTPIQASYDSPTIAANDIREQVYNTFGFTVNIGISDKKILAKMASDFQKPNLVHTLYSSQIKEKMWPMPVSSLYMCGKSSVETLTKLEIQTIGDLANCNPSILIAHLKSQGKVLWEYANGIDDSLVVTKPSQLKGIGNSTTLDKDVTQRDDAFNVLLRLSDTVAGRLRHSLQCAYMISIEIKYSNFQTISHQTTLPTPTNSNDIIYQTSCRLFESIWNNSPIRLLGIRTSKLQSSLEPQQLSLFSITNIPESDTNFPMTTQLDKIEKNQKLDLAIDKIRQKYGDAAIVRGSLLKNKE